MRPMLSSMGIRPIAVFTVVALVVQLLPLPLYANEAPAGGVQGAAPRGRVENTQIAIRGGIVTITYDLIAPEGQRMFDVSLEVSTDGGRTYDLQPRSMAGDVGRAVPAGPGKQIVWEAGKDVESLPTSQFRFRVVITVDMRSEQAASVASGSPSQIVPAPAGGSVPRQQSRSNPLFWPGLGMFGAGGALAALAAAGPLRNKDDYIGFYELTPNKPVLYGGLGVAATGLILVLLDRRGPSNAVSVTSVPGGILLFRVTRF